MRKDARQEPAVKVVESTYQPSKAELEADVSIDVAPEEVARALVRTVNVQHVDRPISSVDKAVNLPVPLDFPQRDLFIEHDMGGSVIPQRPRDGYINATLLCQRAGKSFGHYHAAKQTKDFLDALFADIGIPISGLVQIVKGGSDRLAQGTWVHPQVAIHLGQWVSPVFSVKVTRWVTEWISGNVQSHMPVHVKRFLKNRYKIPHTHFSMLNEIYLNFLAPLEDYNIIPPDKMMPDISTGRMFSGFLRSKGIDPDQFPRYEHEFADTSRPTVWARLYPIEYLPDFRRYFNETWLPDKSDSYLKKNFPRALPHVKRILKLPSH